MLPSGLGRSAGRLALQPAAGRGLAQGHSGDARPGGRVSGGRFLPASENAIGSGIAVGPRGQPQEHHNVRRLKDSPVCSWSSEVRKARQVFLVLLHDFSVYSVYSVVAVTQIWHKVLWPFHVGYSM